MALHFLYGLVLLLLRLEFDQALDSHSGIVEQFLVLLGVFRADLIRLRRLI